MQFTTADIHAAEDFSKALSQACTEVLGGKPLSQALDGQGISTSAFKTLLRSLKKSNGQTASENSLTSSVKSENRQKTIVAKDNSPRISELEQYRHPAWQDDLVSDICGDEEVYVPKDFDETLEQLEEELLDDDERLIIDSYYKKRQSLREVAAQLGINESNAALKKNAAIRTLKARKRDLVMGREYIKTLSELQELYDRRQTELKWMNDAITFLAKMNADAGIAADEEERSFFKEEGMLKLSEVIGVSPSELLSRVVKSAYGYVEALKVPDDERLIYPDTLLSDLDLPTKSVLAFERAGLSTVGDVLALSEAQACAIPGVSAKLLLHICWMILGEENG